MNEREIRNVLVVGAGWVGRQIAARFRRNGISVSLTDRNADVARDAERWILEREQASLKQSTNAVDTKTADARIERAASTKAAVSSLQLVDSISSLPDHVRKEFDCVLECVPEQLSLKKRVLRQLGDAFPATVIIASNSSYFVPSLLTRFVKHPERFAHIHFHVPVLNDSVTDIVGSEQTSQSVIASLRKLSQRIGLDPLVLRREHPGYVFNWMLQSLLKSALELVALDVVDSTDVDKSWKKVTGMPIGPFGMMDQIGLDVIEQVLANSRWAEELEIDPEKLLAIVRQHVRAGELGTKVGKGFYEYDSDHKLH